MPTYCKNNNTLFLIEMKLYQFEDKCLVEINPNYLFAFYAMKSILFTHLHHDLSL